MDTQPHNGAVITLLAVTGLTRCEAYRDIFIIALTKTAAGIRFEGNRKAHARSRCQRDPSEGKQSPRRVVLFALRGWADAKRVANYPHHRLVGIVTDRDLTYRVVDDSDDSAKMSAQDVMSKDIVCCSPDDDVGVAIEVMEAKKIRRLPVADSRKAVIGMLSLGDISHKLSKDRSGEVLRAASEHHA